jgi:hypothetical protein
LFGDPNSRVVHFYAQVPAGINVTMTAAGIKQSG